MKNTFVVWDLVHFLLGARVDASPIFSQGSLVPVLKPVPAFQTSPFLLRAQPSVLAPADVARSQIVITGLAPFMLSTSGVDVITSTIGLPRVLRMERNIGAQPLKISLFLDKPLTPGVDLDLVFRFNNTGPIDAPDVQLEVKYSTQSRPNMYATAEIFSAPLNADVAALEPFGGDVQVSLLAPAVAQVASTPQSLNFVSYSFAVSLPEMSVGDVLMILPLSFPHIDFQVEDGAPCPPIQRRTLHSIGVNTSWQTADCKFLRTPDMPASYFSTKSGAQQGSNSIEITITDATGLSGSTQIVNLVVPAPFKGSLRSWLVALRSGNCSIWPMSEDNYTEWICYRGIVEFGVESGGSTIPAGLLVAPQPMGAVVSSTSRFFGAGGVLIHMSVTPGLDLWSTREEFDSLVVVVRPTTSLATVINCRLKDPSTMQPTTASVSGTPPECNVQLTRFYLGSDASFDLELEVSHIAVLPEQLNTTMVGFSVAVQCGNFFDDVAHPVFGEYALVAPIEFPSSQLFLTGLPRGRPVVCLLTLRTSSKAQLGDWALENTWAKDSAQELFPSWRAPTSCSSGCARWRNLSADGSAVLQEVANPSWGANATPPAHAGRSCARPAVTRRDGPWCYCRGGFDDSWGYCSPPISRLRMRLEDASKWRLLSAIDSARLPEVPESYSTNCGLYLRDFSSGSSATRSQPRRCWGDTMQGTGDSVVMEWWPGAGIERGQYYAVELVGIFLGQASSIDPLLRATVESSSSEGPYVVLEEGTISPTASALQAAGTAARLVQQPLVTELTVELVGTAGSNPTIGQFRVGLLPGANENQWLREAHLLQLILYPLASWNVANDSACPHFELTLTDPDAMFSQPSCLPASIGGDGVGGRANSLRFIIGAGTVLTGVAPSHILVELPMPAGGLLGTTFALATQHSPTAWYVESLPHSAAGQAQLLTWAPSLRASGFVEKPEAAAGHNLTVKLQLTPAVTLKGSAGARVRITPAVGFFIHALNTLPPQEPGNIPLNEVPSDLHVEAAAAYNGASLVATVAERRPALELALPWTSVMFAGSYCVLQLVVETSAPSFAERDPWNVQLIGVNGDSARAGPEISFQSNDVLSAGIIAVGKLRASVMLAYLHASARTSLTIYFVPAQTHGIIFKHIILTAPAGYDFGTTRIDRKESMCDVFPKLNLPQLIQCQPARSNASMRSFDVATIILPPLSTLQSGPYGFEVGVILPPYDSAWVGAASGDFRLETKADTGETADVLTPLPRAEYSFGSMEPATFPPMSVYPHRCGANVRIHELQPDKTTHATLNVVPWPKHLRYPTDLGILPPLLLIVHAPLGYRWDFYQSGNFDGASWDASAIMPVANNSCLGHANILCFEIQRVVLHGEELHLGVRVRTPLFNPDVPQTDGRLPTPALWHVEIRAWERTDQRASMVVPPADRLSACVASNEDSKQIRRIYAATAVPSSVVIGSLNDVTLAISTVTMVPQGGAIVVVAPAGSFAFGGGAVEATCEVTSAPPDEVLAAAAAAASAAAAATSGAASSSAVSAYGLPLPTGAVVDCSVPAGQLHMAVLNFTVGQLPPAPYLFTVKPVLNVITVNQYARGSQWQVYTVGLNSNVPTPAEFLDSPVDFPAFSVLELMQDAFIDTTILDVATTNFTKRRGKQNQVVICFQQAVATPPGQTLAIFLPEGFRILWEDTEDCFQPDPTLGMPPVEIARPFGNITVDETRFAPMPDDMQMACSVAADGSAIYLSLSVGLAEMARYYSLRVRGVQNADRNPTQRDTAESVEGAAGGAKWRLQLGRQATPPIVGFALQAFLRLEVVGTVTSLSPSTSATSSTRRLQGSSNDGPVNVVELIFRPSVPIPAGGALKIVPPVGFELVESAPKTSRGILFRPRARCKGEAIFLGAGYSYDQCEATCKLRASCSYYRIGFGSRDGECVQEGIVAEGHPEPCQEFEQDDLFNVYRIVPTGNCFRFELREGPALRRNVDCSLEKTYEDGVGEVSFAQLNLAIDALPLSPAATYIAMLALRNPRQAPEQNLWTTQSFSDGSLLQTAMLDDGWVEGFALIPAMDYFQITAEPVELLYTPGAELDVTVQWAPSAEMLPGTDLLQVGVPWWFELPGDLCESSFRMVKVTALAAYLSDCELTQDPFGFMVMVVAGSSSVVKPRTRLDFVFTMRNPEASVVRGLAVDDVGIISVTHTRRTVSTTDEVTLTAVASSATAPHTLRLSLVQLTVQQTFPQFAIADQRPISLEIRFQLQSSGADQVWLTTTASNPLDFSMARCSISAMQADVDMTSASPMQANASTLFGQFACVPAGPVNFELASLSRVHFSELRVDVRAPLAPALIYQITLDAVGSAPYTGAVKLSVATSMAERSVDFKEFKHAAILDMSTVTPLGDGSNSMADDDASSNGFWLMGRLVLRPVGQGSYVAISASAEFGAELYIAGDRVNYLTLTFSADVAVQSGERVVVYPTPRVDIVDGFAVLRRGEAIMPISASVTYIGGAQVDDVFRDVSVQTRPRFRQRLDVVLQPGAIVPPSAAAALQFPVAVPLTSDSSDGGSDQWLVITTRVRDWSRAGRAVSNSNQYEWSEGAVKVVPAFDPRASMLRVSDRGNSMPSVVAILLAPFQFVPRGWVLRIRAPPRFLWTTDCVTSTNPLELVRKQQCSRDGLEPNMIFLLLNGPLNVGVVHELVMSIVNPSVAGPPNTWEIAVVKAVPAVSTEQVASIQPSLDLLASVPEQVIRLPGYGLLQLEAFLEPQQIPNRDGANILHVGLPFLLNIKFVPQALQGASDDDSAEPELGLLSTDARPMLRIVAPYPVVADCPPPVKLTEGNMDETQHKAWRAWEDIFGSRAVEYPHGAASFYSAEGGTDKDDEWIDAQLLGVYQRPLQLLRCTREGRRVGESSGDGGQASEASSVLLEFGSPVPPGKWLAVPLLARVPGLGINLPSSGSAENGNTEATQESAGDDDDLMTTPLRFWSLRLLDGAADTYAETVLGASDLVQTRPQVLGLPSAIAGMGVASETSTRQDLVEDCIRGQLCSTIEGNFGELPPPLAFQLDTGVGVAVVVEVVLPTAMEESDLVPVRQYREAFASKGVATPFPAGGILASYLEIVAPFPMLWTPYCHADPVSLPNVPTVEWYAVCFGNLAFLSVARYVNPTGGTPLPVHLKFSLSSATLVNPEYPTDAMQLPLSGTWTVSLFKTGVLIGQRLVQAEFDSRMLRFAVREGKDQPMITEPVKNTENASQEEQPVQIIVPPNSTVSLGADRALECAEKPMSEFVCPLGMFAYGVVEVRLGGVDSWMDNMQLLCVEELSLGANETAPIRIAGSTSVVGDVLLGSRAAETQSGAQVDTMSCATEFSSLLVGGRVEAWRDRRVLGVSFACAPWILVARGNPDDVPPDAAVDEMLTPVGASSDTSQEEEDATQDQTAQGTKHQQVVDADGNLIDRVCAGEEPIEGSSYWAACETLPGMQSCKKDPASCCCEAGTYYVELLRRCEVCIEGKPNNASPSTTWRWRYCPSGSAIAGFRVALLRAGEEDAGPTIVTATEEVGGEAVDPSLEPVSICAVELLCRPLGIQRYAGPTALAPYTDQINATDDEVAAESEAGSQISFIDSLIAFDNLQWFHYAIGGVILLITLRIGYVCCCKSSQVETVYGDEEERLNIMSTMYASGKHAVEGIYYFVLRRIYDPLEVWVLGPSWRWLARTRLYRWCAPKCRQLKRWLRCFCYFCCPCLVILWKCLRCCCSCRSRAKQAQNMDLQTLRSGLTQSLTSMHSGIIGLRERHARGELTADVVRGGLLRIGRSFPSRSETASDSDAPDHAAPRAGRRRGVLACLLCPCCRRSTAGADAAKDQERVPTEGQMQRSASAATPLPTPHIHIAGESEDSDDSDTTPKGRYESELTQATRESAKSIDSAARLRAAKARAKAPSADAQGAEGRRKTVSMAAVLEETRNFEVESEQAGGNGHDDAGHDGNGHDEASGESQEES